MIEYPADYKTEDDFLFVDRSYRHMRYPPAKPKPDPSVDKRVARSQELHSKIRTIKALPMSAVVRILLNFVPEPVQETTEEDAEAAAEKAVLESQKTKQSKGGRKK